VPADATPVDEPLRLDIQFNPATIPWPRLRDGAVLAERVGFGAIWVYDHLAGASVHGDTMLEAFSLLGALAAVTDRVMLGTSVLNVGHRRPAITAVAAATVSTIADRPIVLGLGAGASPTSPWADELHVVGQAVEPSLARRHAAVEDVIETCRRLWAPDRPAQLATVPRPRPGSEIHVGANSPGLARLAGRSADGLNVGWQHGRRDELIAAARAAATEAGRSGPVITTYLPWDPALLDADDHRRREMARVGIGRVVLLVRDPAVLADVDAVLS
jgi:coenzyme F420-dependent glucose-6-phosphate dehydrogenase